jgi:ATP-dependent Lon protease
MTNEAKEILKRRLRKLPMMPIRDMVIFPHMMTPFVVGRESSVRALEEALAGDRRSFWPRSTTPPSTSPSPDDIYQVGTMATSSRA